MPPAGYKEVITGPARRATAAGRRLIIEPALVERLLAETAEGADALPLLALTLERLYRDFGDDGDLTVAEYESMGGMAQVVQTEVDKLLAADPEQRQAQLDILHDAFIPWLATINPDNDQPMRRLARWDDLPAASHPLIQAMVEKRLLVKDTRDGQIVVEVALESLLRQWRELAAWLRDEAQDLKDADSLERAAADWQASGRDESWLLEGTRLAEAETLAAKPGFRDRLDPTRDYLQASRQRENDRIEAEKQRQQAELQAAKEHAAALRKRSRILVAVLAVTADDRRRGRGSGVVQADQCAEAGRRAFPRGNQPSAGLRGAVDAGRYPIRWRCARLPTTARGTTTRAEAPDDGRAARRAGRDGRHAQDRRNDVGNVSSVAFSPDGQRIVSGSATTTRCGCGTPTPASRSAQPLTGHTGPVSSVAFSPDGKRIVSGSGDNTVRVWDADTGQPIGDPLTGHTGRGVQRGVQPRRQAHRLRQRRQDGAAVGRGHRPADRRSR